MPYVIYNIESTILVGNKSGYKSAAAAKAAITRLSKRFGLDRSKVDIADYLTFCKSIEKTRTVKNMMSGREVQQPVNTPRCCDVSSETYWSM